MDHEVQQPADLGTEFVPFQGIAQGFASGDRTVRDMIPTTGKFNACNRVRANRCREKRTGVPTRNGAKNRQVVQSMGRRLPQDATMSAFRRSRARRTTLFGG